MTDILWYSSVVTAAVSMATMALASLLFLIQEGRLRLHLAVLLCACTLQQSVGLVAGLMIQQDFSIIPLKIPRIIAWTFMIVAATRMILFQIGKLNGRGAAARGPATDRPQNAHGLAPAPPLEAAVSTKEQP